jgi:hypothetical protein
MKVFISYGDVSDQVTALRLQALAAVNGLTVYVPPAHTRRGVPGKGCMIVAKLRRSWRLQNSARL